MGLLGEGAEGHRAGGEAAHDGGGRFDLVDGHGRPGRREGKQAADGALPAALVVGCGREAAVGFAAAVAGRALERGDRARMPGMALALEAEAVAASVLEARRGEAVPVPAAASAAISSRPMPPTRDTVPVKKRAMTSGPSPTASNRAAPR